MSRVSLNCAGCGEVEAARIPAGCVSGVAHCWDCGEGIDVAHAFGAAPWCVLCGEDVAECVCVPLSSCGECGREVDWYVCRVCAVCPEPAGYWAWDRETSREYLIGLERAAARESDPEFQQVMIAHHAVMTSALGMDGEGE